MAWMLAHAAPRLAAGAAAGAGDRRGDRQRRRSPAHGHVVDFIQWYVKDHYWPAFNIADAAVVGGAIGIGLFGLFSGKPRPAAG